MIRKLYPLTRHAENPWRLVLVCLAYFGLSAISGVLFGLLSALPLVPLLADLVRLYCMAGIVVTILCYIKVL